MEVRDCRDLPVDSQWTLINHRHSQALIRWSRSLVYYHLVNSNQIAIGNENTGAFVIDVCIEPCNNSLQIKLLVVSK